MLRMCTTELEVGLVKIGGFVTVTVTEAGEPRDLFGEPCDLFSGPCDLFSESLAATERLLRSWLFVLLFKGLIVPLDGENRERRFFRRYSRGKLM